MVNLLDQAGSTNIGLEMVQTEALVQIFENLAEQIMVQARAWDPIDRRLADKLKTPYEQTKIELPPQGSYYPGVRLGLLGMPWSSFPAVAVMADSSAPTPEGNRLDFGSHNSISLYIEALVKSDPFESGPGAPTPSQIADRVKQEGLVDRRAKRTMEALVQCIAIDRSLGGLVPALADPTTSQTDPFTLDGVADPETQSTLRVFSMIRIQYNPGVYASWPDASTPAPVPLPSGLGA